MQNGRPIEANNTSFSGLVLDPAKTVLAIFTARGCGRCEAADLGPAGISHTLGGAVEIVRCPFQENLQTFRRYRIARTPTLMLFGGGVPLGVCSSKLIGIPHA